MSFLSRLRSKSPEPPVASDPSALVAAADEMLGAGRLDEAIAAYRAALLVPPPLPEARFNLGIALQSKGEWREACDCFRAVLAVAPRFAPAHLNLGNALRELHENDEALASYRRAVESNPQWAAAHVNLGNALKEAGRAQEALDCYARASELDPAFPHLEFNVGNAYQDLRRFDLAAKSYAEALERDPYSYDVLTNFGNALRELGAYQDAIDMQRRAIALEPDSYEAHDNLGNLLKETGRNDEAIASYREALRLRPDAWHTHSNLLLAMNHDARFTPSQQLSAAQAFGEQLASVVQARPCARAAVRPRRLRVGLISGDFRNHPVGYFLEGLVANVDPGKLELNAYPTYEFDDALTGRLRGHFAAWRPIVGVPDDIAAERLREDGLDIMIDLSGHTARNRLPVLARRVAPVQATWLGYFGTTGVHAMDYVIGDPIVTPPGEEWHFTERVCRLPQIYLCFTPPDVDSIVTPPPVLHSGRITFGCFNSLAKINEAVIAVWSRVLAATPESMLLLKCRQLNDPKVRIDVAQQFAAHGIAEGRLLLEGPSPRSEYLASYGRVDIALDPFPYPGGTVSTEALWMGVPTLTRRGDRFLSHLGETIASNAGLDAWIADDAEDYVAKATRFAADVAGLAALRASLRTRVLASPLFDAPRFARHFEAALDHMWEGRQG